MTPRRTPPSGTMLKLVDHMKQAGYNSPINVAANRAGKVPGTHEIGFDSAADTLTLRHQAHSREGFSRGALMAGPMDSNKERFSRIQRSTVSAIRRHYLIAY